MSTIKDTDAQGKSSKVPQLLETIPHTKPISAIDLAAQAIANQKPEAKRKTVTFNSAEFNQKFDSLFTGKRFTSEETKREPSPLVDERNKDKPKHQQVDRFNQMTEGRAEDLFRLDAQAKGMNVETFKRTIPEHKVFDGHAEGVSRADNTISRIPRQDDPPKPKVEWKPKDKLQFKQIKQQPKEIEENRNKTFRGPESTPRKTKRQNKEEMVNKQISKESQSDGEPTMRRNKRGQNNNNNRREGGGDSPTIIINNVPPPPGPPKKESEPDVGFKSKELVPDEVIIEHHEPWYKKYWNTLVAGVISSSLITILSKFAWEQIKDYKDGTWTRQQVPQKWIIVACCTYITTMILTHSFSRQVYQALMPSATVKLIKECELEVDDYVTERHENNRITKQTKSDYIMYKYVSFLRFDVPPVVEGLSKLLTKTVRYVTGGRIIPPKLPSRYYIKCPKCLRPEAFDRYYNHLDSGDYVTETATRELVSADLLHRITNTATTNLLNGVESLHSRVQNAINSNTDACLAKGELFQSSVNGTVNLLSYSLRQLNSKNTNTAFQKASTSMLNTVIGLSTWDPRGSQNFQWPLNLLFLCVIFIELNSGFRNAGLFNGIWELLLSDGVNPTPIFLTQLGLSLVKSSGVILRYLCSFLELDLYLALDWELY